MKNPHIIAVTNDKGGVGKTTAAAHIAAGLAISGHKVAIVDTDTQGHVALMFGIEQDDALFRVMMENGALGQNLIFVEPEFYAPPDSEVHGELWMLRAWQKTYRLSSQLSPEQLFDFQDKLFQMNDPAGLNLDLDFIIIDTQPTTSAFDASINVASDAFLYVTECESLSVSGLLEAMDRFERFNRLRERSGLRPSLIAGILPNKARLNTKVHRAYINNLAQEFGIVKTGGYVFPPMRLATLWNQACEERVPMFRYAPTSEAANDMWRVIDTIKERVNQWTTTSN